MKRIINLIKKWWNNPCSFGHDYRIETYEDCALVYKCTKCNKIKIQLF